MHSAYFTCQWDSAYHFPQTFSIDLLYQECFAVNCHCNNVIMYTMIRKSISPKHIDDLLFLPLNPLKTRNPYMGTLANSEDPDGMPHNVAFHQGLHCMLWQNQSSEK